MRIIRGRKGEEELGFHAIGGLIISAILIVVVFYAIWTMAFGGGVTDEMKARTSVVKIAKEIPDHYLRPKFESITLNLPTDYRMISEPLCNGFTNLTVYEVDNSELVAMDSKYVKADNVFRGHIDGRNCADIPEHEDCILSSSSRIYCETLNESGSRLALKKDYCVYTMKQAGKIYAFVFKHKCTWTSFTRDEIIESVSKCHKFQQECTEEVGPIYPEQ